MSGANLGLAEAGVGLGRWPPPLRSPCSSSLSAVCVRSESCSDARVRAKAVSGRSKYSSTRRWSGSGDVNCDTGWCSGMLCGMWKLPLLAERLKEP